MFILSNVFCKVMFVCVNVVGLIIIVLIICYVLWICFINVVLLLFWKCVKLILWFVVIWLSLVIILLRDWVLYFFGLCLLSMFKFGLLRIKSLNFVVIICDIFFK